MGRPNAAGSKCGPVSGFLLAMLCGIAAGAPIEQFANPPDSARPWVYWFIMDGNLSREGITADLESMKEAGIGGVILMEVNVGIPRGPVAFMSEAWRALFKHAVEEAERLGLQITLNAGPGWTGSGGPWVKPEQSMQHLVASSVEIAGPAKFNAVLPRPEPRKPYFGDAGLSAEMIQARNAFYADVAVLAVPNTGDARLADIDEKALYVREPYTSKPGVKPYLPAPATHPDLPPEAVIARSDIIDLTDRMGADGKLAWDVPAGEWTILRFGRRNTGANTRPAPQPGLGLECDKFDSTALDAHFDAFIGKLLRTVGPRPADRTSGWTMLHIDSWEMGAQNWTAGFGRAFQRRRGYAPLLYLPTMTGRVVESVEVSERFLWDLRITAQELVIENHARHLKELGRLHGFGLSIEPYDMNPTSDMTLGGVADVPMCEFWSHGFGFDSSFSCIEATSIAHTLGRPIVAAEAFTAGSREAWKLFPAAMKNQGDWALCTGINRFVFHRFAHQPWLDRRPGMTMGPYGVHWDRTQTWWPMVSAYHRYLARCQFLLRQGATVADVCYLLPQGAPHVFLPPPSALQGELRDRRGYNFDGCTPETLIANAVVKDGRVVLPGGAAYRLLVLPSFETMTPTLLRKIKKLVESGATVVGEPPRKSPSLSNYPKCDREVESLAASLWGGAERPSNVTERRVGRGRIVWGGDLHVARPDEKAPIPIEQARWIWYPEENPAASVEPATRYFRCVTALDPGKRLRSARIEITADNEFQLWVNGQLAGHGSNFHTFYTIDVGALLKSGDNVLAVEATNAGDDPNPAGLIAILHVEYEDGSSSNLFTGRQWQAARQTEDGWRLQTPSADGWISAKELGPAGMNPWRLNAPVDKSPELYPDYQATARVMTKMGLSPDFETDGPIRYTHRHANGMDIYFVANRAAELVEAACTFRIVGRQPELWDPLTGMGRDLPEYAERGGRTAVPMRFEPHQSFFVVFSKPPAKGRAPGRKNFPQVKDIARINGPWDVSFDVAAGGPKHARFSTLDDWSKRPEPGIKYYSGIATYRKTFDFPDALQANARAILLDLGKVRNMARVRLNGHDLGVVWCAPWRVDITDAVQVKGNHLEIKVANLWPNRLIGDKALPPEQRVTWTTWNPYESDSPLLPSGLLGPVRLVNEK